MSKKVFFLLFSVVLLFGLTAAAVDPESVVPALALSIVTVVILPFLVEGVKILADKTGQAWLLGKTAATIYCWVIAMGLTVIYYNWKALPPLPSDPKEIATILFLYGSTIAQIATNVYNVVYAKWLEAEAQKPGSLLSYKLK